MSGNTDDKQIDAQADGVNGNGDAVEHDVEPAGGATPNVAAATKSGKPLNRPLPK